MASSATYHHLFSLGKKRKLKDEQLITQWIFGLFPDSIVLVSRDGDAEIPDENGRFLHLLSFINYDVMGDSITLLLEPVLPLTPVLCSIPKAELHYDDTIQRHIIDKEDPCTCGTQATRSSSCNTVKQLRRVDQIY